MQKQTIVLLSVFLVIIIVFGFGYFSSVRARQDYLDLRNTRLIVRLGNQISTRVHAVRVAADNQIDTLGSSFPAGLITKLRDIIPNVRWIREARQSPGDSLSAIAYPSFIATLDSIQLNVHYVKTFGDDKSRHFIFDIGGIEVLVDQLRNADRIFHEVAFVRLSDGIVVEDPANAHGLLKLDSIPDINGRPIGLSQLGDADQVGLLNVAGDEHRVYIHPLSVTDVSTRKTESERWAICGLVDSAEFRSEGLAFSFITLVILVLLAVLLVLSWPILRIKLLDPGDRVRLTDVIAVSLSVVFGSCVLTLLVACVLLKLASTERLDGQLQLLGKQTAGRLVAEIDSVSQSLDLLTVNFKSHWRKTQFRGGMSVPAIDSASSTGRHYPFFDQFYGVNENGDQIFKARVDTVSIRCGNVRDREYFSRISGGRFFSVRGHRIAVQPLISKSTGEFSVTVAALGGPGDSIFAKCIDFRPIAVMNPVLPPGFEFCIMDAKGEVLFHSKAERNLQENFLDETGDPAVLQSAIASRTDRYLSSAYWGEDCEMYITPVDSLPWFVATLYPLQNTYIVGLQTVSTVLFFFVAYISPFVLVFLICLVSPLRLAEYLWPDREKATKYALIGAFAGLTGLALLAILIFASDSDSALLAAGLLPHMCVVFAFVVLSPVTQRVSRRLWILAGDMLLLIFLCRVTPLFSSRYAFPVTMAAFCVLAVCSVITANENFVKQLGTRIKSGFGGWFNFRRAYVCAVFLFLITGVVLPTSIFFKCAFEEDVTLYVRQNQLQIVHKLENRRVLIEKEFGARRVGHAMRFLKRRLAKDSDQYFTFFNATRLGACPDQAPARRWIDTAFVRPYMPAYDDMSMDLRSVATGAADSTYSWYSAPRAVVLGRARPLDASIGQANDTLWLSSVVPVIEDLSARWSLSRWALIGIVISGLTAVLFFVIRFVARGIFLIDIDAFAITPKVIVKEGLPAFWKDLEDERKFVLYRVARDGFVNAAHVDSVTGLMREGLILRSPQLCVATPELAAFVRAQQADHGETKSAAADDRSKYMKMIRIAMVVLLMLLILFLFWTQRQLWTATLTFISAVSVVLPLVFKVVGSFDGKSSQSE